MLMFKKHKSKNPRFPLEKIKVPKKRKIRICHQLTKNQHWSKVIYQNFHFFSPFFLFFLNLKNNEKDTINLPIAPFVLSHWLAISGVQPIIPQNPLILRNTTTSISSPPIGEIFDEETFNTTANVDMKSQKKTDSGEKKENEGLSSLKMKEDEIFENNENVEVKPLVKHVLSKGFFISFLAYLSLTF